MSASFAASRGFATFLLSARINRDGKPYVPRGITNADARFVDAYERNGWGAIDLLMKEAMSTVVPFPYSAGRIGCPETEWSAAMKTFGLHCGHVVPMHAPDNQALVLVLCGGPSCETEHPNPGLLYAEALAFLQQLFKPLEAILGATSTREELSEREKKILTLVAHGKPIKVIAATCDCSAKTVNNVIESICRKFHVATREQAVGVAAAANMITVLRGDDPDVLMLLQGL